ncbi:MAG TPA: GWxTD domain-containing protein [Thermoanaerobaculia bacterium]
MGNERVTTACRPGAGLGHAEPPRAWRRQRWSFAVALLLLEMTAGCTSTEPTAAGFKGALLDSPTRWLMLPEERRQAARLQSRAEERAFLDEFWRRRNLHPESDDDAALVWFRERVDAADQLYGEGGTRGSLTDRGRALILLGPPPVLRVGQRRLPALEPPGPRGSLPALRGSTNVEIWSYLPSDLPPALLALLGPLPPHTELVLVFAAESKRTRLIEGERLLDLAVQAAAGAKGRQRQ